LQAILHRAIEPRPTARYESVDDFSAEIRRFLAGELDAAELTSIAVLPFNVLQDETNPDEFLGVAMADALITKLSNVRQVSVRSTRSVLKWSGNTDPVAAGIELGVAWVLDGQLRKVSDRFRLTVQLISIRERAPVWAEAFDESAEDLLALEDRLSTQVAVALVPHLSGDEQRALLRKNTANSKAYEFYLKGRWYWSFYTEESLARALVAFTQAIAADPLFANAHAGIADYYLWLGIWGGMPASESFAAAKESAVKAVDLDPNLAEAHASLGFSLWAHDRDFAGAEREFRHAIRLNPNLGRAHQWLGMLQATLGRHEQAAACLERARATDPSGPVFASVQTLLLYHAHRYQEGLSRLNELTTNNYEAALAEEARALCLAGAAQPAEAVRSARKAVEISGRSPTSLAALGAVLAQAGESTEAKAVLEELRGKARERYVSGYLIALVHAAVGNRRDAMNCLKDAADAGDWWVLWSKVQPQFDRLHDLPPFRPLMQKLQLSTGDTAPNESSRKWPWRILAAAVLIVMAAAAAFFLRPHRDPFDDYSITKVTTNGLATHAALSPDGRYVAYSIAEQGRQAIWLRQLNSASTLRLTPPLEAELTRMSFSPDGTFLSFVAIQHNNTGNGVFYRVPILGGALQKVLDGVSGPVSLSPDEKLIALIRPNPAKGRDDFYLMDADGSHERLLASRIYPNRFSWPSTPSWSHDGKNVLCAIEGSDDKGFYVFAMSINVKTGATQIVRNRRWQFIEQAIWTDGDKGLLVTGREQGSSFQHIWYLRYPSGEATQIANDLADYSGLTVDARSKALVSVQVQTTSNVWVTKPNNPMDALQITPGVGRYFDLKWAPHNKLIYATDASGSAEIRIMDADGTSQRQLTSGVGRNYAPQVSAGGDIVVFHSNRSGNWNIWRMNAEGGAVRQLTFGTVDSNWPQITADSKSVVYHHTGHEATWNLWKVPMDGGDAVQLTRQLTTYPALAPQDGRIACWYSVDAAKPRWQLAIFPPEGGSPVQTFDVQPSAETDGVIRWTPDNKGITYIDNRNGGSNIWLQPLDGGPGRPLTSFTSGQIYSFDWAPNGRLAYSRGVSSSDVVLLTDTRR
jgi:Tol biopolymer transport system component/TolB-like protein/Flp pilus assembly protein TadD